MELTVLVVDMIPFDRPISALAKLSRSVLLRALFELLAIKMIIDGLSRDEGLSASPNVELLMFADGTRLPLSALNAPKLLPVTLSELEPAELAAAVDIVQLVQE